jgi:hypothetical protein
MRPLPNPRPLAWRTCAPAAAWPTRRGSPSPRSSAEDRSPAPPLSEGKPVAVRRRAHDQYRASHRAGHAPTGLSPTFV